jgi:hypothetical protein
MVVGVLLLVSSTLHLNAQLLQNKVAFSAVKQNIDLIYNADFKHAHLLFDSIKKTYPGSPIVYLLHGIMTYWENFPLLSTSAAHISFENDMKQSIALSQKNSNPEFVSENLLSNLCARGMLLTYYADNNMTMRVIPLTTSTYSYLMRAFDATSDYADFRYFTGVYNYYREAYPEKHPVYNYMAFVLRHGNMEIGLKELKLAGKNSILLSAESYSRLSWIYLNMEHNYTEAMYYSRLVFEKYPRNEYYRFTYIQNLLLLQQYDQAEKLLIGVTKDSLNNYFKAQLQIFNGILQEKKYGNLNLAENYYNDGIRANSIYNAYGEEYIDHAKIGLRNISQAKVKKEIINSNQSKSINFAGF